MIIESFEVVGLNGRETKLYATFGPGVNILTGRNGAGKTSILKLLWYLISGNISIALDEVNFQRATLKTDMYEITVHRINRNTCKVELTLDGEEKMYFEDEADEDENYWNAEMRPNQIVQDLGGSIFFPTFRRIEGGFTLNTTTVPASLRTSISAAQRKNAVEDSPTATALHARI